MKRHRRRRLCSGLGDWRTGHLRCGDDEDEIDVGVVKVRTRGQRARAREERLKPAASWVAEEESGDGLGSSRWQRRGGDWASSPFFVSIRSVHSSPTLSSFSPSSLVLFFSVSFFFFFFLFFLQLGLVAFFSLEQPCVVFEVDGKGSSKGRQ
jgi:hypothetical protein